MEAETLNNKLKEVFAKSNGYFGRVYTWGQTETKYVSIGCAPDVDTLGFIQQLNEQEKKNLTRLLTYFEMHGKALKYMLGAETDNQLDNWFIETSWSHFATVIMFGLLEAAIKTVEKKGALDDKLYDKGNEIKNFLEKYISQEQKISIVEHYKSANVIPTKLSNFSEVIDDMWNEHRSGFIHSVGVHAVPLEPHSVSGIGTKESPLSFPRQVAMYEWLILAWQAILNAYGYKGKLNSN